jgi:Fe-S-cluster containining protein
MSQACLSCGACCATFRVSFYWSETSAHPQGTVPIEMTVAVNPYLVCMKNTEANPVRCIALKGEIGSTVTCSIYSERSSTCREFEAGTEACNKARLQHGLSPLIF